MGYVFVLAPCIGCGRVFGFHPEKVPSLVVNGVREPVCRDCVERANPVRKARGLAEIVPLPGAYEPQDEHEADWLVSDDFRSGGRIEGSTIARSETFGIGDFQKGA